MYTDGRTCSPYAAVDQGHYAHRKSQLLVNSPMFFFYSLHIGGGGDMCKMDLLDVFYIIHLT